MRIDEFEEHEVLLHKVMTYEDSLGRSHRLEHLVFKRPNSGFYYIEFIMHNNYVHVTGDVGEATYWWSDRHDLAWVSQCDLSYFSSKCTASPVGVPFKTWTEKTATRYLEHYWEEREDEERVRRFKRWGGWRNLDREFDWIEWLRTPARGVEADTKGEYFFGPDYLCEVTGIGFDIDIRCEMHLAALKLAVGKEPRSL